MAIGVSEIGLEPEAAVAHRQQPGAVLGKLERGQSAEAFIIARKLEASPPFEPAKADELREQIEGFDRRRSDGQAFLLGSCRQDEEQKREKPAPAHQLSRRFGGDFTACLRVSFCACSSNSSASFSVMAPPSS